QAQAFAPGLANHLPALVAVQQELATAQRLVIGVAAMAVGADGDVVEKRLAVLDASVAVAQVHPPLSNRLDFGPKQHDARLEGLEKMEVVERLPVLGDCALCFFALGFFSHGITVRTVRASPPTTLRQSYSP